MPQTEWLDVKTVAGRVGCTERAIRNYLRKHGTERDANGVPFVGDMERNGKLIAGLSESFAVFLVERYGKAERNGTERSGTGSGNIAGVDADSRSAAGSRGTVAGRVFTFGVSDAPNVLGDNQQFGDHAERVATASDDGAAGLVGELRARIAEMSATIEHERREKADLMRLLDQQQRLTLASETRQIGAVESDAEKKNGAASGLPSGIVSGRMKVAIIGH